MRFFTSFHFAQNNSKLGRNGCNRGMVFRQRRKNIPLLHKKLHETVIPIRSEESNKINRTTVNYDIV